MTKPTILPALMTLLLTLPAWGAQPEYADGKYPPPRPPALKWVDLLSGKLTDHWSDMNCTLAGSFKLKADDQGVPVLAGSGQPIALIRSMRAYENFILEVDWRHLTEAPSAAGGNGTTGNSGLYVWADPIPPAGNSYTRAIEVQVCNLGNGSWYTSHGDLFPIHGATMIPDPRFGIAGSRSMPIEFRGHRTGEWNHCRITCVDGTIQQEFNGALVTAGFRCSPRKGYLCIESEGGPVEFKNMRISELPGDSALKPSQRSIELPDGARTTCLYDGLDLSDWKGAGPAWQVQGHTLRCTGKSEAGAGGLSRVLPDGDGTLIVDWGSDKKDAKALVPIAVDGLGLPASIPASAVRAEGWNRLEVTLKGGQVQVSVNGKVAIAEQPLQGAGQRMLRLLDPGHPMRFCNVMWMDGTPTQPE